MAVFMWRFSSMVKRRSVLHIMPGVSLTPPFPKHFLITWEFKRELSNFRSSNRWEHQIIELQKPEVSLLPHTFAAGLAILSHFQPVCFTPFERLSVLRKFRAVGNPLLSQSLAWPRLPCLFSSYLINAAVSTFPALFTCHSDEASGAR